MTEFASAAFWSYAHDDDELDRGRPLLLAQHLKDEYTLLTGKPLEMFVDRDGIAWGEEWKARIDTALVESAFFLPVITPRYFARPECRRELLAFHTQASSRGLPELLLAILYIPVADLDASNSDEALALVARMQFVDWSDLRLTAVDSVEYRRGVNKLAVRLAELVAEVSTAQLAREVDEREREGDGEADFESLLRTADELWPDWLDAVQSDEVWTKQFRAVIGVYGRRVLALRRTNGSPKLVMAAFRQEGRDSLPLMEQHLRWAETYSARTIELDPIVTAVIRAGRESTAMVPLLHEMSEMVRQSIDRIQTYEEWRKRDLIRGGVSMKEHIAEMPFPTRVWREIHDLSNRADALVKETNAVVLGWHRGLTALLEAAEGDAPSTEGSLDLK